jgi:conserved oligomeric Golgi complex subunit 5
LWLSISFEILTFYCPQKMYKAFEDLIEPVTAAIRRDLGAIIEKLHCVDFTKAGDSLPGMGGPSCYMSELVDKLAFIKEEVLNKFDIGDASRSWFGPRCCIAIHQSLN